MILSADISLCCEMRTVACTLIALALLWDSVRAEDVFSSLRAAASKLNCYFYFKHCCECMLKLRKTVCEWCGWFSL